MKLHCDAEYVYENNVMLNRCKDYNVITCTCRSRYGPALHVHCTVYMYHNYDLIMYIPHLFVRQSGWQDWVST